jgi:hypothetical protein
MVGERRGRKEREQREREERREEKGERGNGQKKMYRVQVTNVERYR